MEYTSLRNKEICITVEKANRSNNIVVSGCFYEKNGKDFKRYFSTIEKAMAYYNKQLEKAVEMYLSKCELILNK